MNQEIALGLGNTEREGALPQFKSKQGLRKSREEIMWNGNAKEQRRGKQSNSFGIGFVFWFLLIAPPSRTSSLLHAAMPGALALHIFNGCLPNQAFTAGNFSAPHCVRRRRAPFLAGLSTVPGCLVLAREEGRWGGWGCGVGPVPTLQLCSFFPSLTIAISTKPLRNP